MSLAQRVRDFRYSKGWGPDELASRAAISRTALYQIESGKTELPRAGTLRRIALALDVPMDHLLGHGEVGATAPTNGSAGATSRARSSATAEWFPSDGMALAPATHRNNGLSDTSESRFAVEFSASASNDGALLSRERELGVKLHAILESPFGDSIARILDETFRLLPQTTRALHG